jgi:hypothetical protein
MSVTETGQHAILSSRQPSIRCFLACHPNATSCRQVHLGPPPCRDMTRLSFTYTLLHPFIMAAQRHTLPEFVLEHPNWTPIGTCSYDEVLELECPPYFLIWAATKNQTDPFIIPHTASSLARAGIHWRTSCVLPRATTLRSEDVVMTCRWVHRYTGRWVQVDTGGCRWI